MCSGCPCVHDHVLKVCEHYSTGTADSIGKAVIGNLFGEKVFSPATFDILLLIISADLQLRCSLGQG